MSKHTPGPWVIGESDSRGIHCVDARDPNRAGIIELCEVFGVQQDDKEDDVSRANARLIAAAPDLLEALKLAVNQNYHDMQMTGEELRICEMAIAKATGSAE